MKETIFSPADVLLPDYAAQDPAWAKWSVIACDQFTSEKAYWDKARAFIGDAPSALDLILPEAFLKTPEEEAQKARIRDAMNKVESITKRYSDALVYVERTLTGGVIRKGIVGKIDLKQYDFSAGSASAVRPTEATVLDRIPPRKKIRSEAAFELPHVMVFTDAQGALTDAAEKQKALLPKLYDFELMAGGGHLTGYLLQGNALTSVLQAIEEYESEHGKPGEVIYAVGDGNHSLAAAKAHYEDVKTEEARYALCEIVDIADDAIVFEPIYRIVKHCDVPDLLAFLEKKTGNDGQTVSILAKGIRKKLTLSPVHALTVGSLQIALDEYLASHPDSECDYIHGEESLEALCKEDGVVGFLFDGMQKCELFPYVEQNGVLPRKTFSMGNSYSKRYYTELRKIR